MDRPTHFAQPEDSHLPVAVRAKARAQPRRFELVPDGPLALRVSTIAVRRDDKAIFDTYSAFCEAESGQRLTQWETFTMLVAEAMENPSGRFARWSRWQRSTPRGAGGVSPAGSSRRADPRTRPSLSRVP